ncbi:MAG: trypsin-like peptidase domain-containing protein [Oscillospiraceae bacterium]|nr:trypsin-like peptidase domain-containing protein [Oscillospiraceae bacterium]
MKRLLSLLLSVVLVVSICPTAIASNAEHKAAADILYSLGLVSGTGTDASGNPIYELDRAPTRSEAITVLVKLLGMSDEAGKGGWNTPFTDVPGWAQNFVGYAYANGLTAGTSATTFGGDDLVTASQYITFVLKALGYSANGDFQWDKAWELSDKLGITDGRYNASTNTFVRGDVFMISEAALKIKVKGSEQTLAEKLIAAGAFTREQYDSISPATPERILTAPEISKMCSPAVFLVEKYDLNGVYSSLGSGFFISADGLAVTNHHVVADAHKVHLKMPDGTILTNVKVIGGDQTADVALLKVEGQTNLPFLSLGDSDSLVQGETVYAIGSPIGLENTMSQGIVSNPRRILGDEIRIQISVPIDHGSSGGALINQYGEVVGITSGGFESSANLNLAVPINFAKQLDMTATEPLILHGGETYPNFEHVLDFGSFSGVTLKNSYRIPLGYLLEYDLYDFHALDGTDGGTLFSFACYFYHNALIKQGLAKVQDEQDESFFGTFRNDKESVLFYADFDKGVIYVLAERTPNHYARFPKLLDLGWYLNLACSDSTDFDDGATMYRYSYTSRFSLNSLLDELDLYFEHLEEQKFACLYAEDGMFLFEGNGLSVVIMIKDNSIIVDIKPQSFLN